MRLNRIFKGVCHLGAKYYIKGLYLPPTSINRYIGKSFCYNFSVLSFHWQKIVSDFIN